MWSINFMFHYYTPFWRKVRVLRSLICLDSGWQPGWLVGFTRRGLAWRAFRINGIVCANTNDFPHNKNITRKYAKKIEKKNATAEKDDDKKNKQIHHTATAMSLWTMRAAQVSLTCELCRFQYFFCFYFCYYSIPRKRRVATRRELRLG